jgi:hypothetical protein
MVQTALLPHLGHRGHGFFTGWFVRHPGQYEGLLDGHGILESSLKLLFETGRADVSVRANEQRELPSAGIALSIKPTVLLCRSLTEDLPCAGAQDGLHPTPAGIEAVVTRILPQVEALVARARR